MAANTEQSFNNFAQSRIVDAISASATSLTLIEGGVVNFLPGYVSTKEFYCTLVDASANREIIKVTAISGDVFTIERGQDDSTARAWPAGSLIEQRLIATNVDRVIQKEGFRTVAYNPNGVLSASYPGEKIYQTGGTWWKNVSGTIWQAIAGYTWVARFDNTKWTADSNISWDGTQWDGSGADPAIKDTGTWVVGYRPTKVRITFSGDATLHIYVIDSNEAIIANHSGVSSGDELAITFGSYDIDKISFTDGTAALLVTNIEFTED
ncbi:hypothetical protein KAX97_14100 [candidate division WOR-3 bacterium]|nr:hypothetical protein [candidate division WOR-3 bacterium]